ncbi:MAG: hypothetical protein A2086_14825 [Spirochaetes bacterium GWD1_27_9]|nr:MAG: hypothetical protein A2Z98_11535 [Spirochaetes bacterium GWB1_27_13]OHD21004.1 MAG: hypothetical protein A2Y34_12020 [Spirochaetes bacterium GWC1_27_15]OHD45366.1 MAG: hypothetical protein A2086_14825 [Spirochaetes bacterium GWD1_27_9]
MIIDSHVHIGNTVFFETPEDILIKSMKKYKIDFGIVSSLDGCEYDPDLNIIDPKVSKSQYEVSLQTLQFVKKYPDMFKGLIWIKPDTESFTKDLENFMLSNKDYICGFKTHPYHSKLAITDKKYAKYLEFADKHNLPFEIHTAKDIYSKSEFVYEVAKDYKNINFIMVHLDLWTDNSNAINLLPKLPNLYGDTTWVSTESVLKAIKIAGSNKILFGSDSPIDGINTYEKYQDLLKTLKKELSTDDYENVIFKNAKKIFNILNHI